jgi:hypothetical protein
MKKLVLKILFCAAMIIVNCGICNAADTQIKSQTYQNFRQQQIDKKVAQKRQQIEDWYAQHFEWIREAAQVRASELNTAQQKDWVEFATMMRLADFDGTYFLSTNTVYQDYPAVVLRNDMMASYFLDAATQLLIDPELYAYLNASKEDCMQSNLVHDNAIDLLNIMEEFQNELKYLENQKNIRLAELNQWQTTLQDRIVLKKPKAAQPGVISAINYDTQHKFAMIDSVIVYQGSVLNSVKIVNIDRYKIQFEKNGKLWIQRIGDKANTAWNS